MRTKSIPSNARISAQFGAAAVELAFVTVVLLLIVAGTLAFGRTFWYADALTKSTRDGARLLSTWPIATVNSAGVVAARDIAINSANAANLSPQLTTGNVLVECLNDTFGVVACIDGTTPVNVRVSITGFNVNLDEWFPFIGTSGVINYGSIELSPHTTLRYMN
jgi:Flp pilus assembly protein TadG